MDVPEVPAAPETPAPEAAKPTTISEASERAFEKLSKGPDIEEEKPKEPVQEEPKPVTDDQKGSEKPAGDGVIDEKTLTDLKQGKIIPKHRFDEILERAEAYKAFGSPEDIVRMQSELKWLRERLMANGKPGQEPAPKDDPLSKLSDEDKANRDYFLKLFPESEAIKQLTEKMEKMEKEYQSRTQSERQYAQTQRNELISKAELKIKSLAEERGIDVKDEAKVATLVNTIANMLHEDKELATRFYNGGDVEAVKDVFEKFHKMFFSDSQRAAKAEVLQDKKLQTKLPKPPVRSGSGPSDPPNAPPKTLDEAGNRAWERLQAG